MLLIHDVPPTNQQAPAAGSSRQTFSTSLNPNGTRNCPRYPQRNCASALPEAGFALPNSQPRKQYERILFELPQVWISSSYAAAARLTSGCTDPGSASPKGCQPGSPSIETTQSWR